MTTPRIFIDADACPVRDETYRAAGRHGLHTIVVSNRMLAIPASPLITRHIVEQGPDIADDWIAEHAGPHDIVITADIPLAARCIAKGAQIIDPRGRLIDADAIGMALATRNLMDDLRSTGAITTTTRAFTNADRSTFLSTLDTAIVQAIKRARTPTPRTWRHPE